MMSVTTLSLVPLTNFSFSYKSSLSQHIPVYIKWTIAMQRPGTGLLSYEFLISQYGNSFDLHVISNMFDYRISPWHDTVLLDHLMVRWNILLQLFLFPLWTLPWYRPNYFISLSAMTKFINYTVQVIYKPADFFLVCWIILEISNKINDDLVISQNSFFFFK